MLGVAFIRKIDKKTRGRHVDFHPFCKNAGSVKKFDSVKLPSRNLVVPGRSTGGARIGGSNVFVCVDGGYFYLGEP